MHLFWHKNANVKWTRARGAVGAFLVAVRCQNAGELFVAAGNSRHFAKAYHGECVRVCTLLSGVQSMVRRLRTTQPLTVSKKNRLYITEKKTRVAYLPTSCQLFSNCVRPGENVFSAFACKFDTGILAVGSCSVFDEFTCRFSRTSVCRGSFFFPKSFFTIFFRGHRTVFWREDLQVASCHHPPAMRAWTLTSEFLSEIRTVSIKNILYMTEKKTRVAYLPTSCQLFSNCVRPGENVFSAFACKFDTGILAVGSCSVFDEFTCRFSRTSVCRGSFFFQSLSLPFSSVVIERSFDGRICRWRAAIIHLQCGRELWIRNFFLGA